VAFYGNKFTEADLSATRMTALNLWTFAYCPNLETVKLPKTLTAIGDEVFSGDRALKTLVVEAVMPPSLHKDAFKGISSLAAVYVPDASVAAYQAAANWSAYAGAIKGLSQWTGK